MLVPLNMSIRYWIACALALTLTACGGSSSSPTAPTVDVPFSQTDLVVGTGTEAVNGRRLTVNYTGWLYDPNVAGNKGTQFDSSAGKDPLTFTLGVGGVILGWDRGVPGMRVGGQRRLVIPPGLGYGASGSGSGTVPPNATLIFDIELLAVQ